jgi:hypothetical protein
MRYLAVVMSAAILAGCGKKDAPPAADSSAANNARPPAEPMDLAKIAGTWDVQLVGATTDSVLLTYKMTATADTTGWSITFPNREPVPMRVVSVAGDSAVVEAGPYESALRPGVQVRTVTVMRLRGDRLMSHTDAHYDIGGVDSVIQLRSRGRRAQ